MPVKSIYGHRCHAKGCDVVVPPKLLMCARHWSLVPMNLKRQVWATYRPGQEINKRPSEAYLVAQRAAIEAVERAEAKDVKG